MTDPFDALAADDPIAGQSRARLLTLLVDRHEPATTSELADEMRLHPNGVRRHLGALESAGLVTRAHTEGARGRPADTWTVAAGLHPTIGSGQAYRELSRWLARAIAAGATDPDGLRVAGRALGREYANDYETAGGRAEELNVGPVLAAMGFAPRLLPAAGGRTTLQLGNCPYREAAAENQPAICGLHRGMTEGLLDVLAPDAELTRFVPGDPRAAGCLLEIDRRIPPTA